MVEGGRVISRICMHSLLSLTHRCISSFTFKVDILCFIFAYQFFIYNLLYLGIVSVSMYTHMCMDALVCASSRVHVWCVHAHMELSQKSSGTALCLMQWGNVSQLNLEITNVAALTAILFGDPVSSFQAPELEVGPHAYLAFMQTLTLNLAPTCAQQEYYPLSHPLSSIPCLCGNFSSRVSNKNH